MTDGGEVGLDWSEDGCPSNAPIIIILPGLTGSSQAEYIKCLVLGAKRHQLRVVVFNNRGLGGLELKVGLKNKLYFFLFFFFVKYECLKLFFIQQLWKIKFSSCSCLSAALHERSLLDILRFLLCRLFENVYLKGLFLSTG